MFQDIDTIETPENVYLERELAGIGSRFAACFVDYLMIFLMMLAVWVIMSIAAQEWPDEFVQRRGYVGYAVLLVIQFVIYWGYFAFFEAKRNGQTPGKKNQKIRTVMDTGGPVTFLAVIIRNLIRPIDILFGPFSMFITSKWQRLGDLAAGTVVVSEEKFDYSSTTKRAKNREWKLETSAEALQASGLSPEELSILTNYWMRRHELTLDARQHLMKTLIGPILQRKGIRVNAMPLPSVEREVARIIKGGTFAPPKLQSPGTAEPEARDH
jgi:uncharacterized RDD family membrane protein YckC